MSPRADPREPFRQGRHEIKRARYNYRYRLSGEVAAFRAGPAARDGELGDSYGQSGKGVDLSSEFSRFEAGPRGAPWEKQDQFVVGAAWFVRPSVKLFAEYVRVDGFAPLNFISGGSIRDEDGNVLPDRGGS